MSTIITRLFDSREAAMAAVAELRRVVLYGPVISVTEPGDGALAALLAAGVAQPAAEVYASRVQAGGTAVTVGAPFGEANNVRRVLRWSGGIDLGSKDDYVETVTAAAPLSGLLGWRVLCNDPTPLSSRLGLRTLSRSRAPRARLINQAAPLSRLFMLPTLTRYRGPRRTSFGFPLLSRNPAPLSSLLGLKLSSPNPAPLSERIGMPLLFKDPTPLSSNLALPVLTKERR